jgi:hypothetical protein
VPWPAWGLDVAGGVIGLAGARLAGEGGAVAGQEELPAVAEPDGGAVADGGRVGAGAVAVDMADLVACAGDGGGDQGLLALGDGTGRPVRSGAGTGTGQAGRLRYPASDGTVACRAWSRRVDRRPGH